MRGWRVRGRSFCGGRTDNPYEGGGGGKNRGGSGKNRVGGRIRFRVSSPSLTVVPLDWLLYFKGLDLPRPVDLDSQKILK
jgi:hypothetical protein